MYIALHWLYSIYIFVVLQEKFPWLSKYKTLSTIYPDYIIVHTFS